MQKDATKGYFFLILVNTYISNTAEKTFTNSKVFVTLRKLYPQLLYRILFSLETNEEEDDTKFRC